MQNYIVVLIGYFLIVSSGVFAADNSNGISVPAMFNTTQKTSISKDAVQPKGVLANQFETVVAKQQKSQEKKPDAKKEVPLKNVKQTKLIEQQQTESVADKTLTHQEKDSKNVDKSSADVVGMVTKLNSDAAILNSRLRVLEKEAQIASKRAEIAKYEASGISDYGMPIVKAIEGMDGKLSALLVFQNGSMIDAEEGDILPNGMLVTKVKPGIVTISKGKQKYRLAFSGQSGGFQTPNITGQSGLPLPPSVGIVR